MSLPPSAPSRQFRADFARWTGHAETAARYDAMTDAEYEDAAWAAEEGWLKAEQDASSAYRFEGEPAAPRPFP